METAPCTITLYHPLLADDEVLWVRIIYIFQGPGDMIVICCPSSPPRLVPVPIDGGLHGIIPHALCAPGDRRVHFA